jgi:hypothetical protein
MKWDEILESPARGLKDFLKNGKIEYLGLPYTDDDPLMEDWRADISDRVAADLFTREGRIIFAPISAWHHIARKYELPGTFEYWAKFDEEFIKISTKLLIIMLPGWKDSTGVNGEIKLAHKYNIPIEYIDPEPYFTDEERKW